MAAPLDQQTPMWISPCGLGEGDYPTGESEITEFVPRTTDGVLLKRIALQARTALSHAQNFRDKYVKCTFKQDLMQHHSAWSGIRYSWLPSLDEIPKTLDEPLEEEFLKAVQFDEALKNTYEYLQKFAVGLEQIVYDQKQQNSEFLGDFMATEFKVRATLCEIQVAMLERNVTQKPDVYRAIMSDKYRSLTNSTDRNLRDWLIFRDYMNGLQFVVQVFEYLKDQLAS